MFKRYPFTHQHDYVDCGPACLQMITKFYGKNYSLEELRQLSYLSREGVSFLSLNDALEGLGFRSLMVKIKYDNLINNSPFPCILHWDQNHFVVLYGVKKAYRFGKRKESEDRLIVADPAHGIVTIDKQTFLQHWISTSDNKGTALVVEPSASFYTKKDEKTDKSDYWFLLSYIRPYYKYLYQLGIGMLVGSLVSLILPFLTQILIDQGVNGKDFNIITIIILAQVFFFMGEIVIDVIRGWVLLNLNTRISLNIISDFLIKLFQLPIKYFDSKAIGDIYQRIADHHRVESFLTEVTLNSLFSLISILVYSGIMLYYDIKIFAIFLLFSMLAVLWILLFQKKRKILDYKVFMRNKENQDKLLELITGMQEIKLFGGEVTKRWDWERLQLKLFRLNIKGLVLEQYQKIGFTFFSQLKNILIIYILAREVVYGNLTLGVMLSVSYIIGQTNGPLEQLVTFFRAGQDAKISMDRLQEIHNRPNEVQQENSSDSLEEQSKRELLGGDIVLENVYFQYDGPRSPFVLQDVSLRIPKGKVTAIVGASGSGKTTLMKLLLQYYTPVKGSVKLDDVNLSSLSPKWWRSQCGTVMQEGFIFSDTITNNIVIDGNNFDKVKFQNAVKVSNIAEFVEKLPVKYTTRIGNTGIGLSGGQKQRILIARAVYKNPDYIFFDEATSSLDANNENLIMKNLNVFFDNKTVVVIAHRLSTVKNADQIIVLDKGQIVETGTHKSLSKAKGTYYDLVKNQLELGG